jgi:hypothetical protein
MPTSRFDIEVPVCGAPNPDKPRLTCHREPEHEGWHTVGSDWWPYSMDGRGEMPK